MSPSPRAAAAAAAARPAAARASRDSKPSSVSRRATRSGRGGPGAAVYVCFGVMREERGCEGSRLGKSVSLKPLSPLSLSLALSTSSHTIRWPHGRLDGRDVAGRRGGGGQRAREEGRHTASGGGGGGGGGSGACKGRRPSQGAARARAGEQTAGGAGEEGQGRGGLHGCERWRDSLPRSPRKIKKVELSIGFLARPQRNWASAAFPGAPSISLQVWQPSFLVWPGPPHQVAPPSQGPWEVSVDRAAGSRAPGE